MAKIAKSLTQLIGHTPLLQLERMKNELGYKGDIIAKLEYFNPLGSSKDRVAFQMIEDGFENGIMNKDTVLIEPTSGNTGIGLAMVSATKGMRLILTMPDNMSVERIRIVKALGAEVVLTPAKEGMAGAIKKAEELKEQYGNAIIPQQFENPSNSKAHMLSTGPEIYDDTDGKIDFFVAGVGTGGTLTGTGRYLKERIEAVKLIAIEPENSAVMSGKEPGTHGLQGIGGGFIPKVMDMSLVDEIITIKDEEAYEMSRMLAGKEGVFVGISAGAAMSAAVKIATRAENKDKNIVVLLPDTGERYLSTPLWQE